MVGKKQILLLSLVTLIGLGGIGVILIEFLQPINTIDLLKQGLSWYTQVGIGLVYGFISAYLGWKIINTKLLSDTKIYYGRIINDLDLNIWSILFISFSAGVGEELLFRGALQYWGGIWITSIVFVAIHGYLNPKNWKLSIYGVYMTLIIIGLGYALNHIGIISCMAAHFAIDVYLLKVMSKKQTSLSETDSF